MKSALKTNDLSPPLAALDSARVRQLYQQYGGTIFGRCSRLLRSRSDAEDATQEIFLRVLKHVHSIPSREEAIAWIHRIATNYCLNYLRDKKRHAEPTDKLPEQPVPHFENAVFAAEIAEKLLADATPQMRAIVHLFHVRGIEQKQIAATLGISRRTVIYRLGAFAEKAKTLWDAQATTANA